MPRYLDPKQAISLTESSAYTRAELDAYDMYWDSVSTEETLLSGKFKMGKEQGLVEGREEGTLSAKKDIAFKLLSTGMLAEQIATLTNLSIEEIVSLRQ